MRRPRSPRSRGNNLSLLLLSSLLPTAHALAFQQVPPPNLDLSGLGRVVLAGNFESASIYQYTAQNEDGLSSNGSQSLYGRYPTGAFAELQSSDAYINAMCEFQGGIVLGGNFTNVGSTQANAAALYDPNTGDVTPLTGLNGYLNAVYCDNNANTVYVGGFFTGGNSTNAIVWTTGWTNLPFAGFNGPVSAITQLPNGNVIFGGSFTAAGNLTEVMNATTTPPQVVNVGSANITSTGSTSIGEYSNPSNIICTTPGKRNPSASFLLQDDTPGSIQADFGFGFEPSVLRLLNTQVEGYGTKTWRYTALPLNGIMNFTYVMDGQLQSCTNECPLVQNSSYQDFYFVNTVGMDSFRIDISDWYGNGGGLGGIELLQNQIWSYAVDNFNSPNCDGISNTNASSKNTGDWTVAPSGDSYSQYLSTYLPNGVGNSTGTSVIFMPNIEVSGNYSINMWTPGCLYDNTCDTRGEITITANFGSPTGTASAPYTTTLYQTNNNIKFDQIYYGYVQAGGNGFQPSITLTPSLNQLRPLTVVAQSLGLNLTSADTSSGSTSSVSTITSSGGINGLFEYNPNEVTQSSNFTASAIDTAGNSLNDGASVLSLAVVNEDLYVAGLFNTSSFNNIMAIINGKATDLGNGGLNSGVQAIYYDQGIVYAGGNFSATKDNAVAGLNSITSYSVSDKTWHALGAGVNGIVYTVVPISVNISGSPVSGIAFSGAFNRINAFGSSPAVSVLNSAIWIPSEANWLVNLNGSVVSIEGRIESYTTYTGMDPFYAGSIDSQTVSASDIVGLSNSNGVKIEQYPITIENPLQAESATKIKRVVPVTDTSAEGVFTALFYNENGLNLTILGGRFSSTASNGSTISNLAIINGTNQDSITGFTQRSNAQVRALENSGSTLLVGGSIDNGLVFYDLTSAQLSTTQPGAISGRGATVNAIAPQPSSQSIYVGGSFDSAASLGCPGLCIYSTSLQQWNPPPASLSGDNVINILQWASNTRLILAGVMTIDNVMTTMATYNPKSNKFTEVPNAHTLPGPITAYSAIDNSYSTAFVSGTSVANSTAYLSYFDGQSNWTSIAGLGPQTKIEGLQTLSLSSGHGNTGTLPPNSALLVMGMIELPSFGNVSAALFNGTDFTPFVLSTLDDGSPGTIYGAFVQNPGNLLNQHNDHYSLGIIVLIGLACALGTVFLLVVIGILIDGARRRREGYAPAPTYVPQYEKTGNVGNISPERLFGGVGGTGEGGPRI